MFFLFSVGVDFEDCWDVVFNCLVVFDWYVQKDLVDDF